MHRSFEHAAGSWPARTRLTAALVRAEDYEAPGLPILRGRTAFYRNRRAGESDFCLRRADIDRLSSRFAAERVLLDPAVFHPTGTAVINAFSVSPDGTNVVAEVALDGRETGQLVVIDAVTGTQHRVPRLEVRYSAAVWLPDSSGFSCTGRLDIEEDSSYLCIPGATAVVVREQPAAARAAPARAATSVAIGERHLSLRTDGGSSVLEIGGTPPARLDLGLDRLMHVDRFSANTVGTGHEAWIVASDPGTPPRLYRLDPETGQTQVFSPAGGGIGGNLAHQRLTAPMSDGAEVDLLVTARRDDLDPSGLPHTPRALILTCYGGFGVSSGPEYEASVPAWLELGGVFVTAQIRGGGEKGPAWHEAGRRANKLRSITDLIECAVYLQRTGWCTSASLCLMGASHGGLVVLAAALRRPGLCAAVACTAPLLDMTQFHREGLGARWLTEFGHPDDPTERARLLRYSPRHLLEALPLDAPLPAVLCAVFEADERVPAAGAAEFVKSLRRRGGRAWLRSEAAAGHGPKPLDQVRRFSADVLSFAAAHTE
ncbi:prolyl oligopeptidase family serine peptidase [Cryobacterium roopkundense]|uniref:Prolyl oligopeptidase PreP (S9A serine peptidase family) n=2 Tax=Cryobacterium roopkundense TaxID=1001240 RepID=A0A7W9E3S5_9MICO|nr:prolyl oligopeptidase family serine peptidase [Cryobacterium roopkundense]MBB5640704.1 prolyl oligopeptidase PreP (S9A serine peptidase family) [Cryobacterium roopkundense]